MKKIFLCFTVVVASLLCFPMNASATLSEDSWNQGEQIEGLSVTELEFSHANKTVDAGRENKVTIKVKLNQKLDPKYNDIYLFAEKEDNALEAQIIGKTEEHFWLERDSEDSSVFVSEAKNMDRYWKAGEYRITYLGVTALSEPEGENFSQDVISKQLVKLDKTISDKNSFKVENAFFEMFQ
ncbi:MAG: hypothetical protein RR533_10145, partial [Carnobacterium sp.]